MGLVSQEPVLFDDTIRSNIAYGKEGNATESEIVAAAELANVHKFVSSLPQVSFYASNWNGSSLLNLKRLIFSNNLFA